MLSGSNEGSDGPAGPQTINLFGRAVRVPASPPVRMALGFALVVCGILGFLPILGFWMVPLGLVVLSIDFPPIRRLRRRAEVWVGRWRNGRRPRG